MAARLASPVSQALRETLRHQLGEGAQLVSIQQDSERRLRGLAVQRGRILSFVLDAEQQRLRTRPLFELLQHSRIG